MAAHPDWRAVADRETPIDVFVRDPFDFDAEYDRAMVKDLGEAGSVRVVRLGALIAMKESAGREEDRIDVKYLRMRLEER